MSPVSAVPFALELNMTKGYKHLTPEQSRAILGLYQEQPVTTLVASKLGVSLQQVRGCLRRNGIELKGLREGVCVKNHDRIIELAAVPKSYSEIAATIGTNHHRVKEHMDRYNIPYAFDQHGERNSKWRGGFYVDKSGYILIFLPEHPYANNKGYVREHRLIMEKKLGRYLEPHQVVHHKGAKDDPDPSKLEVFASNAEHLRATRKGLTPKWTQEGRRRVYEGLERGRAAIRAASEGRAQG